MKPGNSGGGKEPEFNVNVGRSESLRRLVMSLKPPETVWKLQTALHAKAKESPGYRFYALYDKVYRRDVLELAYRCCRANSGAPGSDGQNFKDIKEYGEEKWLDELTETLRTNTYRADAVRRVYIPKPDGKQRPLGIPTVRTRVVQTAVMLVLNPIFEADLPPEQYAYRAERSALDAVRHVHKLLYAGHTHVIDADLSGYFDSIPHHELLKSVARRVSDKRILRLIKDWLQAPVEEADERGRVRRTTRNKDEGRGCPQGAPISPLLANLYMRRFILGWKSLGNEKRFRAKIVNYADDFVICCRGDAEQAAAAMRDMMARLKLAVNEEKTRICRVPQEHFDFLGYTLGRCWSPKTGRAYIGTWPSRKKVMRLCREISEQTERHWSWRDYDTQVATLNRMLIGWSNYFCLGPVSRSYEAIDSHCNRRLRQWLRRKHLIQSQGTSRFPDEYLYNTLGLKRLSVRTRNLPWAKV
jgi:group II intron reverse transcriptase/maturase